jgi:cytoskeletal protein RodZ
MNDQVHPGERLRAFRLSRKITLRAAARQLRVKHPALKDWEDGEVPSPPYRTAIEVWTLGEIRAADWPLSTKEREAVENAARVQPCTESGTVETGPGLASADSGETTTLPTTTKTGT